MNFKTAGYNLLIWFWHELIENSANTHCFGKIIYSVLDDLKPVGTFLVGWELPSTAEVRLSNNTPVCCCMVTFPLACQSAWMLPPTWFFSVEMHESIRSMAAEVQWPTGQQMYSLCWQTRKRRLKSHFEFVQRLCSTTLMVFYVQEPLFGSEYDDAFRILRFFLRALKSTIHKCTYGTQSRRY